MSVGTSRDTAAFAVGAIRRWWPAEGRSRYPGAARILVTCDAGGCNDCRHHTWKDQLAVLAAETGLRISVCRFPPGTSKWNRIEHRVFCHITRAWHGRPLMTPEDAVAGIAATVTGQGLKCTAVLDDADYPEAVKVPAARVAHLEDRVLEPRRRSTASGTTRSGPPRPGRRGTAPPPATAPAPDLEATGRRSRHRRPRRPAGSRHPAWQAAREQRLHPDRGHARRKDSGGTPLLPLAAVITAAARHHRLKATYRQLGDLLGVHPSTVSLAVRRITPLLQQQGIAPAAPAAKRQQPPRHARDSQLKNRRALFD